MFPYGDIACEGSDQDGVNHPGFPRIISDFFMRALESASIIESIFEHLSVVGRVFPGMNF